MISLLDPNNKLNEHKNSLTISYPRTVNIIFGNYPYIDVINNLIIDIKNNLDSLNFHTHPCIHGILYLTEGCDLILPELNIKISPKPGDYYIFPPEISHGFNEHTEEKNRYSLIFNLYEIDNKFKYNNKLNE